MHLSRWITTIVALPIIVFLIGFGGMNVFALLIGIVVVLAMVEYYHIVFRQSNVKIYDPLIVLGFISAMTVIWAAAYSAPGLILATVAANLVAAAALALPRYKSNPDISVLVAKQIQGVVYTAVLLSFLVLMRNQPGGIAWVSLIVCIIFAGDTAAYYVGTYWGRRKLCPSVSPKKTVEGALGGIAANIVVGSLIKALFLPLLPWGVSLIFFVVAGAAGQAGDLFQSILKRTSDIKDSGWILPGHGGILDRIDALLFAAPVAWAFREWLAYF